VLTLPPSVKVFLATGPADMRRSLDGLSARVREGMGRDPLSGHPFVFHNRRRDRAKVLYWDRIGLCLRYKRLEKGRFHFPETAETALEAEWPELQLLLEGIELAGARRRRRFQTAAR
jgi:transposase